MKTKQPQACAHVAAYYVNQAQILVACIHIHVFGRTYSNEVLPPDHCWGAQSLRLAPAAFLKAVKEFNRAGGVAA